MKTTCHRSTYRNVARKKNQQQQEAPTLPEQYNPSDSSICRRTGKLGAPRRAERCRARGQGLLRGKAGWLALEGWKGTKIGQDQQPCAQRLLRDPRGTPPLRLPPRPCAEAALLRCCAAESPGTEGEVFAPRQVPAATRVRLRSPRPRHAPPEAQPRPKAPAPPPLALRAPPPRSALFSSRPPPRPQPRAPAAGFSTCSPGPRRGRRTGGGGAGGPAAAGGGSAKRGRGRCCRRWAGGEAAGAPSDR